MDTNDIKQPINNILPGEDVIDTVANRPHIDLENNIDKLIEYLQKNPTSNFDVPTTHTGLTFHVGTGLFKEGDTVYNVPQTTLTLDDNTICYVYIDTDQSGGNHSTIQFNTTGFVNDMIPLYEVTTSGGAITNVVDKRAYLTKGMQFSGDKVVVTDPVTGEIVEHPTVTLDELSTLNGITTGTTIESRLQALDNNKLNIGGHTADRVIVSNNAGNIITSGLISKAELETLDGNTENIATRFNDTPRLSTNNVYYGPYQTISHPTATHWASVVNGSGPGNNSYMWLDLTSGGYGRINLRPTDDLGNYHPNTRFEIKADYTTYTFRNAELKINNKTVVTDQDGTAYDAARLGSFPASDYARINVINNWSARQDYYYNGNLKFQINPANYWTQLDSYGGFLLYTRNGNAYKQLSMSSSTSIKKLYYTQYDGAASAQQTYLAINENVPDISIYTNNLNYGVNILTFGLISTTYGRLSYGPSLVMCTISITGTTDGNKKFSVNLGLHNGTLLQTSYTLIEYSNIANEGVTTFITVPVALSSGINQIRIDITTNNGSFSASTCKSVVLTHGIRY